MDTALAVLFIVGAAGSWVFCILYTILAPWWRSSVGRNLWALMAVLAVTYTSAALSHLLGHYPGQEVVQVTAWGSGVVIILRRVVLLVQLQLVIPHRHRIPRQDERRDGVDRRVGAPE